MVPQNYLYQIQPQNASTENKPHRPSDHPAPPDGLTDPISAVKKNKNLVDPEASG